jgi:hypothetical protein
MTQPLWLDAVRWDDKGLVPVIAQEKDSGDVLMFAWMNREALQKTAELKPGRVLQPIAPQACGSKAKSRAMCKRCMTFAWTVTTTWCCCV